MQPKHLTLLHIDDEENDLTLVRVATQRCNPDHRLHAVTDAEQAVTYLCGEGAFADRHSFPLPDLIITDLKMPRMNGFEFLSWLRASAACPLTPTVVLSSSAEPTDVHRAYRLGANSYLAKPASLDELEAIIQTLLDYWCHCQCPGSPSHY